MVVRITRGLTENTVFGKSLERQILAVIAENAQEVCRIAEQRADRIVQAEFKTSRRLKGSFTATVRTENSGPYPVVISLRTTAPAHIVYPLNRGARPHDVGRSGGWMAFPDERGERKSGTVVIRGPMPHPGNKAHYFMERALEQAVAQVYRKTIRIPRR